MSNQEQSAPPHLQHHSSGSPTFQAPHLSQQVTDHSIQSTESNKSNGPSPVLQHSLSAESPTQNQITPEISKASVSAFQVAAAVTAQPHFTSVAAASSSQPSQSQSQQQPQNPSQQSQKSAQHYSQQQANSNNNKSGLLDISVIEKIKESVCNQCDVVKHTVGKQQNPQFIHRFIFPMICNIIDECLSYLQCDQRMQLLDQLRDDLPSSVHEEQLVKLQNLSEINLATNTQNNNDLVKPITSPLLQSLSPYLVPTCSRSKSLTSTQLNTVITQKTNQARPGGELLNTISRQQQTLDQVQTQIKLMRDEISSLRVQNTQFQELTDFEEKTDIKRLRNIEQIVLSSNQLLRRQVVPAIRILTICNDSSLAADGPEISGTLATGSYIQQLLKDTGGSPTHIYSNQYQSRTESQSNNQDNNSSFTKSLNQNNSPSPTGSPDHNHSQQNQQQSQQPIQLGQPISRKAATLENSVNSDKEEESKPQAPLPNMWGQSSLIFGTIPKQNSQAQKSPEQRLRSLVKSAPGLSIQNWTCPLIVTSNQAEYVFTRGKGNKLYVLSADSLETEYVKETSGHCIFSCKVYNGMLYIGCFEGHLFVFDLKNFEKRDYKKLSQGIYDILEVEDEGEHFLIFGQHYGNIDMLRESDLKKVFQANPARVNSVFQMLKTSRPKEVAFFAYNGLYFGKIKRENPSKFDIAISATEFYLTDKHCMRGIEYSPDKMLVCVDEDESFYLLDRSQKAPLHKCKWNSSDISYNFEVFEVPGFDIKKMPFLFIRDDFSLKLFNVNTQKSYLLKEAPYKSQPGKLYRTMDLLKGEDDFELLYLVTEGQAPGGHSAATQHSSNALNDDRHTTQISRMQFSSNFIATLKTFAS